MPGPRDRLIASAIHLVRQRGVEGTGLTELVEHSGAARRSIYQHFAGGKTELIAASTRAAGSAIRRQMAAVLATTPPAEAFAATIDRISGNLRREGFALRCPIAAAAVAVPEAAAIRTRAAAAFSGWIEEWADALVRAGRTPDDARSLAGFMVSAVEGAMLRAHAEQSTEAMDQLVTHLLPLISTNHGSSAALKPDA